MNAPAVRMFAPVLQQVERGLALPIPDRVRILRELEYDLEALYDQLLQEGLSEAEARRHALQALVPDSGTLLLGRYQGGHAWLVVRGAHSRRRRALLVRASTPVATSHGKRTRGGRLTRCW